ncbi:MAG: large conductance mechanosensitive channel protein MscL [Verrucomicrobia bacterium]|nr:large conductance mechanosensitive channel protein MscL [Verrucomicrobiota bacterium]MBI3869082.1 large conductance mechanosensitive channel protein MscL [Verrucomicrobiota bacterium]
MGFISEFKAFAIKGNVIDMAVGVIIGGAFGKIVTSLIDDLVMPVVGKAIGNAEFNNLFIPLSGQDSKLALAEARKGGAVFAYGSFITVVINFIILAFCIFMMVKAINNLKKKEEAQPAAPPPPSPPTSEEKLLAEIRDLLKAR